MSMRGRVRNWAVCAVLLASLSGVAAVAAQEHPGVIPAPARMTSHGITHSFAGAPELRVDPRDDAELLRLGNLVPGMFAEAGNEAPAAQTPRAERTGRTQRAGRGHVTLAIDRARPDSSREGYTLVTSADGVHITARDHAGIFHALQTLRQLVNASQSGGWSVPGVRIDDSPRFAYRGMHLDVARHFFPIEVIKRYIDLLARYKLNTFHWHLTDDQGWRIEILRFPRLAQVGGCRRETMVARNFDPYVGDGTPHCGYYTQEQVREIVAYAAERHITVIPEIEMPGHATAALAAYPDLACTPGPFEVATTWGVFDDIFCPTERTFSFLEGVLTEVMELFPSTYIHIGGDEVPKVRWRESVEAQAIMQREGLADVDALQSWFIARIERFLHAHGRRLVGWDEILDGGLPPRATVMSWRGMAGGIAAARQGHDVIMSPVDHAYFDYYQGDAAGEPLAIGGFLPLERVYAFEPVPDVLTASEARHILGAQGNLWTEYITTPEQLEYMLLPRLLAIAEVAWTPRDSRSWSSFQSRLPRALAQLDLLGVNYRIPEVRGLDGDRLVLDTVVTVQLSGLHPRGVIRYTVDGTEPGPESPAYARPITLRLTQPAQLRARLVLPDGRQGPISAGTFRRTTLRSAQPVDDSELRPGLLYRYFETQLTSVRELDTAAVLRTDTVDRVALRGNERDEHFALVFGGFLRVPESGVYRFSLLSDDGAVLTIGDEVIVDHDGPHGPTEKHGEIALAAGLHRFTVRYFQAGGGKSLALSVVPPGGERVEVPAEWFLHEDVRNGR